MRHLDDVLHKIINHGTPTDIRLHAVPLTDRIKAEPFIHLTDDDIKDLEKLV
jgi:hypothetical protein